MKARKRRTDRRPGSPCSGWSSLRSTAALRDQVAAALTGARHTGLADLLAEQRAYLDEFWDGADVRVGPPIRRVPEGAGERIF